MIKSHSNFKISSFCSAPTQNATEKHSVTYHIVNDQNLTQLSHPPYSLLELVDPYAHEFTHQLYKLISKNFLAIWFE